VLNVLLHMLHFDCAGDTVIDWRGYIMTFLLLSPVMFFLGVASDDDMMIDYFIMYSLILL